MIIGVAKETKTKENRVALTPDVVKDIIKKGFQVQIEAGAGLNSFYNDQSYQEAGATIVSADEVYRQCDVLLKVNPPAAGEIAGMKKGAVLISFMWAASNPELVTLCEKAGISAFSMDAVPRTSRAQVAAGTQVPVSVSALRPGDLIMFANPGKPISHVAIYAGNKRIIHSTKSGGGVRYDDLSSRRGAWYRNHMVAVRRLGARVSDGQDGLWRVFGTGGGAVRIGDAARIRRRPLPPGRGVPGDRGVLRCRAARSRDGGALPR